MVEWRHEKVEGLRPTGQTYIDKTLRQYAVEYKFYHGINVYMTSFLEKVGLTSMDRPVGHSFQISGTYRPKHSMVFKFLPAFAKVCISYY